MSTSVVLDRYRLWRSLCVCETAGMAGLGARLHKERENHNNTYKSSKLTRRDLFMMHPPSLNSHGEDKQAGGR